MVESIITILHIYAAQCIPGSAVCIELKVETLISVYVREKAQQMSQVTDYTILYKDKKTFSSQTSKLYLARQ